MKRCHALRIIQDIHAYNNANTTGIKERALTRVNLYLTDITHYVLVADKTSPDVRLHFGALQVRDPI